MYIVFTKLYLKELYESGIVSDKKHRYQPYIVKRYQKCIKILMYASKIDDIVRINSLNYEVLIGDKAGISSIRINNKYRIEFTVEEINERSVITVCNILELSNHYK